MTDRWGWIASHYIDEDEDKGFMDIFDLYKPFRNDLRKVNLNYLLQLICYVQRGSSGTFFVELREGVGHVLGKVYKWELHLLAREALIHADSGSTLKPPNKLPDMRDLVKLLSHIRRIPNEISKREVKTPDGVLRSLHPIVHQQKRWQNTGEWDRFYRIFRIYNRDDLRPLLEQVTGVRLSTIYTLAMAIAGSADRGESKYHAGNDYSFLGIPDGERDAFFAMVGADLATLREKIETGQNKTSRKFDESWPYTWNPLEGSPLIRLWPDLPHAYLCPFPELLLRRVTEGLFFDLKDQKGFANPYGKAFEAYVGEVLHAQFFGPLHRVVAEQPYKVSRDQDKHGIDWMVSDPTGHLMFECKTRRMTVDAKAKVDGEALTKALEALADIVVQHYKNVDDALQGKTHWKPDGVPVFPVIVTLEDWYLFTPNVVECITKLAKEKLAKINLAERLETTPFIVTSIAEFEVAGQAIAQIGIGRYCASLVAKPASHFGLGMHAGHAFPDIKVEYKQLFPTSGQEMFGHVGPLKGLLHLTGC
ncbi:hypothetical protein [Chromobacterium amazonense]|uniref:Restriction endonuclease n=1 Tax=Chromobacterium amazonense TaxID=1382803 RepID=A0ABU8V538_9NEIS|nr:hypothetical protein [Chromobacterium amazonense]MDQ4539020.1 hypothetical protein [Chromobacterium amazonense]